jgi:hypothetical protein
VNVSRTSINSALHICGETMVCLEMYAIKCVSYNCPIMYGAEQCNSMFASLEPEPIQFAVREEYSKMRRK